MTPGCSLALRDRRGGAVPVADVVAPPELQEGNTVAAMIALLLLSAWVLLYLAGYF